MLLYSTNVFLKFYIQSKYRNDEHWIWCSPNFDGKAQGRYQSGHNIAASSNPADIYRELKRDVESQDMHSAKINAQRASFKALAADWHLKGEISQDERDEILVMSDYQNFHYWRPILYIIPEISVRSRLKLVPITKRASLSDEFIIEDLKSSEFNIIEF